MCSARFAIVSVVDLGQVSQAIAQIFETVPSAKQHAVTFVATPAHNVQKSRVMSAVKSIGAIHARTAFANRVDTYSFATAVITCPPVKSAAM